MLCSGCNKSLNGKYWSINGQLKHYCHSCYDNIVASVKENVEQVIPMLKNLGLDAKVDHNSLIVRKGSSIFEYSLDSTTLLNKTPTDICKKISKDILE